MKQIKLDIQNCIKVTLWADRGKKIVQSPNRENEIVIPPGYEESTYLAETQDGSEYRGRIKL